MAGATDPREGGVSICRAAIEGEVGMALASRDVEHVLVTSLQVSSGER